MYSLVSAIAKPMDRRNRWVAVDIGDMNFIDIFTLYSKVLVTLSNTFLTTHIQVDLETIEASAGNAYTTLNQYLTANSNRTIPGSTDIIALNPKYAKYADGFHAGYKITPIDPNVGEGVEVDPKNVTWIRLNKHHVEPQLFYDYCLVSINGFYHRTDFDVNGNYVIDAMKSCKQSKENQIGIHSFRDIGKLTYVPITRDMIYKQNENQQLSEECFVDLGINTTGKTVMVSIGGYLHILDSQVLTAIGDDTFKLTLNKVPLLERYYESVKYLDLSSLPLSHTKFNESQISREQFYSDGNILAYLMLSQSFFVLIDNDHVFIEVESIQKTNFTDMYISHRKPEFPLIVGYGKVGNYWYTPEDKQYSIACCDTLMNNYLFQTNNALREDNVSDSRLPSDPVSITNPQYLIIGTDY